VVISVAAARVDNTILLDYLPSEVAFEEEVSLQVDVGSTKNVED
jgi:hypothetical protein